MKMADAIDELVVVDSCKDGLEGIQSIEKHKPQLVFLDIQMPGITGLDVLKTITHQPFVIFITAYDQYALRAFELHALDYLLKPFTNERFVESIGNAIRVIRSSELSSSLLSLRQFATAAIDQPDERISSTMNTKKLIVRSEGKIVFIDHEDISYLEGYDYYVKIHAQRTYLVKDSLKQIIRHLPTTFIRVHKSYIVNLTKVRTLEPIGHSEMLATLNDSIQVKVSRSYKTQLLEAFSTQ